MASMGAGNAGSAPDASGQSSLEVAAVESYFEQVFPLPATPPGMDASPGMTVDDVNRVMQLRNQGVQAAQAINAINNSGATVPSAAFGEDDARFRVDIFPAGVFPDINDPDRWPPNMIGAGSVPPGQQP